MLYSYVITMMQIRYSYLVIHTIHSVIAVCCVFIKWLTEDTNVNIRDIKNMHVG